MDWPHSPIHRLTANGAYIVTAATYRKEPVFRGARRLDFLCRSLFDLADKYSWKLQAWAVFPNHYHFVALAPDDASTLPTFLSNLHTHTTDEMNKQDDARGRKVWYQYWDTNLTFPASYFARLAYVHRNPVHHGLVSIASNYAWCSAGWLERRADPGFRKRILSTKTDRVKVEDNFDVDTDHL